MSGRGVLVFGVVADGQLRPATAELIGAGKALTDDGAGPLTVALLGAVTDAHGEPANRAGVEEILLVPSPEPSFEAHVAEAALAALIESRRPSVVLAGHTVDSLGFAPALAARAGLGFATDVSGIGWGEGGASARRGAYAERLTAELDFPGRETVLLLLREGAFEPATAAGSAPVSRLDLDLAGAARTELVERRTPPAGDVDITTADFLLSIGRGVEDEEQVAELEEIAAKIGATLSVSRPLVDAGWVPSDRQVGQSGRTVAPKVYLALGISGAVQHLAGISAAKTIIAVNSDPDAPIFAAAHYGAVADLFEVATELQQQLG
ncbi:MAG: electron transfer flavoprotein subunit alpha/FixB family protein [Actinobacteria bacterium]|nr:electron transfer flavoprotein subunit alpha/FixB family protein [Actinomycetota bacterium]